MVDIISQKDRYDGSGKSASLILDRDFSYPDPRTLPAAPSFREPIPSVTLSELEPGKYISTLARIVYLRTVEKNDALGEKLVFTGLLEDATFKVPFVSHRVSYPLIRDSVYRFHSAYVHEFPDRSLLLVMTEHTKIDPKNVEDIREFIWTPKIGAINKPVRYVYLNGTVTTIHSTSGLIKRCNKCRSIIYYDSTTCPKQCGMGWQWDLRISSKLYDGSGSIKMVMTKDIAANVLQKNLGQLILHASLKHNHSQEVQNQSPNNSVSILNLEVPSSFDIVEAVLPDNVSVSYYTRSDKLIVSDGRNLVYFPTNDNELRNKFAELSVRQLDANGTDFTEDIKIIRRLVERALSINIQNITEKRMRHGIYLLEDPISLYRCERAKMYLGFSVDVKIDTHQQHRRQQLAIELKPHAYVHESVLDYIRLRRERGATANAVIRMLLNYRSKVIVAPTGHFGSIVEVISRKAGSQLVSEQDTRNLVDFWKQVYNIEISPDEIPLLRIKMLNSENTFTYPASMCFFGIESLYIPASVQKFIDYKKSTLIPKMYETVTKAVKDLNIGDDIKIQQISQIERTNDINNIQRQLLEDTRQKLYGRNVRAKGSIMYVHDELWFFPSQVTLL